MNLEGSKIQKIVDAAFWLAMGCIVTRWIILIFYAIIHPQPAVGDEVHFLNYLQILHGNGIVDSLSKSVAINYTMLAIPFSLVLDGLVSLRLVNLILLSFFIYYLYKKDFPYSKYVILLALFYTGKVGIFNVGINDALFATSFAVILIEFIYMIKNGKAEYPGLLVFSAALSLTTRPLVIIYFPLLLLVIWGICKFKIFREVKLVTIIISCLVLLLHVPSLVFNQSPCWDNKTTDSELTWAQRQYLAQIEANKGLRPEGTHPSWEELRLYIEHNGANSLPKTFVESIYFDWGMTVYEFFKDLYFSFKGLLLQTGALAFIFFYGLFKKTVWRDKALLFSFLPLIYALLVFSFIIISNVEWRWYAPVVLLLITSIGALLSIEMFEKASIIKLSLSCSIMFLSAIGIYNLLSS